MFRLLGIPDELRLDIEQASGLSAEGVKLIIETSVNEANALFETATKEIQEVVGPHGSVTRLQAGGVKISQGLGIAVYADGVKKTTIDAEGNILAGSNVEDPANTTFCVFVNEQIYNNELMGAGDLLFGDNSADTSNVKFDASAGQLQFRYGDTVNVYMDTDGTLKAGGGAVVINSEGIEIPYGGDALRFFENYQGSTEYAGSVYMQNNTLILSKYGKDLFTGNLISNGDFATGDFTSWTETDPGGKLSVESDVDEGYVFKIAAGATNSEYIQQNLSTPTTKTICTFRAKADSNGSIIFTTDYSGPKPVSVYVGGGWKNYVVILESPGFWINQSWLRIYSSTSTNIYISDVKIYNSYGEGNVQIGGDVQLEGTNILLYPKVGAIYLQPTLGTGYEYVYSYGYSVINTSGGDYDTVIKGDTDDSLVYVDAGNDRVGIGDSTPSYKLDVAGDINTTGVFRVNGTELRELLSADRTYYVRTDGSDSNDGLTDSSGGAFLTAAKANAVVATIDKNGYNIVVQFGAGTWNEDIIVNTGVGDGTVTWRGTLTTTESVASATVVEGTTGSGTVTKTGQFTGDSYGNLLCYFVTDDEYRMIYSNTANALTLSDRAPSSTTQNVTVMNWGTVIDSITLASNTSVILEALKINGDSSANGFSIELDPSSSLIASHCWHGQVFPNQSGALIKDSLGYVASGTSIFSVAYSGTLRLWRSLCLAAHTSAQVIVTSRGGYALVLGGTFNGDDGGGGKATYCHRVWGAASIQLNATGYGYNKIYNFDTGLRSESNSALFGSSSTTYSGVTTSTSTDATGVIA